MRVVKEPLNAGDDTSSTPGSVRLNNRGFHPIYRGANVAILRDSKSAPMKWKGNLLNASIGPWNCDLDCILEDDTSYQIMI